jgi:LemA protein
MMVTNGERKIASCYQKRADLLTNMEATVRQAAGHEKDVVIGNAQARAAGNSVKLPDNATPEQITAYLNAQSGVMARINSVVESVPSIKANVNFLMLQRDLKNIETQCSVLRSRYIEDVGAYNAALKRFPSNIVANIHGMTKKDQIKFDDEKANEKSPRLFQKGS